MAVSLIALLNGATCKSPLNQVPVNPGGSPNEDDDNWRSEGELRGKSLLMSLLVNI